MKNASVCLLQCLLQCVEQALDRKSRLPSGWRSPVPCQYSPHAACSNIGRSSSDARAAITGAVGVCITSAYIGMGQRYRLGSFTEAISAHRGNTNAHGSGQSILGGVLATKQPTARPSKRRNWPGAAFKSRLRRFAGRLCGVTPALSHLHWPLAEHAQKHLHLELLEQTCICSKRKRLHNLHSLHLAVHSYCSTFR